MPCGLLGAPLSPVFRVVPRVVGLVAASVAPLGRALQVQCGGHVVCARQQQQQPWLLMWPALHAARLLCVAGLSTYGNASARLGGGQGTHLALEGKLAQMMGSVYSACQPRPMRW